MLALWVDPDLGQDDVLVVDEGSFPKCGDKSIGVARQCGGTLGKRANCQVAVSLASASARGHTLLDTRLYLPGVPDDEVLAGLDPARRATLVATATPDGYALDIHLQGPHETVFFAV